MHRQSRPLSGTRIPFGARLAVGVLTLGLAGLTTTCKLQDLVSSRPLNELELAPAALVDSALQGSTAPRVVRVAMAIGGDAVPWTLSSTLRSTWLRPAASSGTAPDTLAVTLDPTGLAAGIHRDTLLITAAGPATAPVSLPVEFRITGCTLTDLAPGASATDSLTTADCGAPHRSGRYAKLYRVAAGANDSLSFRLGSAAFDAYLVVDTATASAAVPSLAENDACRPGRTDACVSYAWMAAAGSFVVEVTTAAAGASGEYILSVTRPRAPAAPDSLAQATSDLAIPVPVGGTLSGDSIGLRAYVTDPDEDSVRLEAEVRPVGTAFSGTPVATGAWAGSGTRASVDVGGLVSGTSYHWQVRSVDRTGRAGPWTLFGPGTADFQISIPHPPAVPASLAQLRSDGVTAIAVGGTTDESAVLLAGVVADSDVGDVVRLEVEVRPVGTAFSNAATASSPPVPRGTTATASVAGLLDNVAYHWQARAVDGTGRASAWTAFGGNAESAADLRVAIAPVKLAVTTQPGTSVAGSVITPAVKVAAQDVSGNTLGSFTGTVTAALGANAAGGTLSGTLSVAAVNGVATFTDLRIDRVGTGYTLTLTSGALTVTTSAFAVTPASAGSLAFSVQPSNATAGVAITPAIQVTARDSLGNVAAGFTDTVRLAITSGTGTAGAHLLGTVGVAAVGGVASFTGLRVDSAGTGYTLTAEAGGTIAAATSAAFAVAPGAASALFFTTEPAGTTAGTAFSVGVAARDSLGNVAKGFTGNVTVAITPGTGTAGAHLLGATTVAAAAGVASFTGLSIDSVGTGYTLSASATGLTGATSSAFAVTTSATTHLAITTQPSDTAQSGVAFVRQPVLQLRDGLGNAVSQQGVVVTAAIATGGGTLGGTATATTNASGVATFTDLAISGTVGSRTLGFTSGALTPATSTAIALIAGPASQLTITTEPSATASSGVAFAQQPVIQLRDAAGNAVSRSGVAVTAAIDSGGGTLGGTLTVSTGAGGAASWTDLAITGTAGTRKLIFTSGTLAAAVSTAISVGGGTARTLAFSTEPPASTTSGAAFAVAVTAKDSVGNTATDFTGNVTLALGGGTAGAHLGGTLTVAAVSGVATFSGLSVDSAGTGYALTASAAGPTNATSSAFAIVAGTARRLAFTTEPPASSAAGAAFGAVVAARDSLGNLATTFAGNVTLALSGGKAGAHLSGTVTVAASSGVATFSGLSVDSAGTGYTLTATGGTLTAGTSSSFAITAGTAKALVFTTEPVSTTAGTSFGVAVTARDSVGNTATGFTGTVALALSGGKPGAHLLGTTSVAAVAGVATFGGLSVDSAGTGYSLSATSGTLPAATSTTFSIIAATVSATRTTVTAAPDTILATAGGSASTITVTAKDSVGNPIQGLTVILAATGSGNTVVQPTSTTDANGVATGGFSSTSPGSHTISATVGGVLATQQPTVVVLTGAATKVVFTTQPPTSTTSGAGFGAVATVQDSVGNTVTGYAGTVAVTLNGGTVGAHLLGTTSVTAASGVATFSGLRVDSVGTGYYLNATSGTLRPGASGLFAITAGTAKTLVFTTEPPASTAAGSGFGVVVTARDSVGNTATGFTGSVTLALSGGASGAHLGGTVAVAAVAGVATFSGISVDSVGTGYQLAASATGPASATSTSFAITAGTARTLVFTTEPPASSTAGAVFGAVVTARDSVGNTATGFTGNVTLALSGGTSGAHLAGTLTVAAASGVATFAGLSVDSAGTGYQLTASALGPTSGTSTAFAVTAGTAKTLAFTTEPPASTAAGAGFGAVVTARDSMGNRASGFTGNVTLALSGGKTGAHLSGTVTVAASSGIATFSGLSVDSAGTGYQLTASATGPASGTSTAFAITAGTAKTLVFTTEPPASTSAGSGFGVVVTARDSLGNTAAGFTGNVTIALTGGTSGAHLGGTLTVAASSGVATFAGLSVDSVGTGYQLAASATGPTGATSTSFAITASAARTLVFTTQPPGSDVAGAGFGAAVTARDSLGNRAAGYTGDVTVAITTGTGKSGAHLRGTVTVAAVAGVATFSGLSIDSVGTGYSLTATSGALTPGASRTFNITAGAAATLRVTGLVAAVAGTSQSVTVTALDSLGNVATGYNGTVHFTSSDAQAVLPLDYKFTTGGGGDRGVHLFTNGVVLKTAGTQSVTATDKATATITGSESAAISPAATISAATSVVSVSSPTVASGATDTLRLQGKDAFGNNLVSGGATVVFSASGGGSTGTISSTTDHGNGTYTAIFTGQTAGTATTIHATVNGTSVTTTLPTIAVTADGVSAAQSTVSASPTSISAGGATSTVTVTAKDANGNPIAGATVVLAATGTGNTLTQPVGTTNASGVATGTLASTVAETKTVSATVNTVAITQTATVTVTAGALDHFAISAIGSPQTAGTAITGVTLTAQDASNNTVTGYTGTVTYSGTAGITGTSANFTAGVLSGVSVTPTVAGTGLTWVVTGAAKTGTATFDVNPGALDHFAISAIGSPQTAGTAITGVTLTAQDASNNTVTGYTGTVTYSGTAGITGTSANFTAGVLSGVSVTPTVAGTGLTWVVTDGAATGTATFDVVPGPASTASTGSTVTANPTTVSIATQTSTITVQLKDVNGNNLSASAGTVTVAVDGTSSGAGLLSSVTDNGDGTYTATFTPTLSGTVVITATLNSAALANTATITVTL